MIQSAPLNKSNISSKLIRNNSEQKAEGKKWSLKNKQKFFDENGYLRYGKVLEQGEVEALIDGLDRIVQIELAGGDDSSVEFVVGHRRTIKEAQDEPRVLTQYVNMWKRDKEYEKTVRQSANYWNR